MQSEVQDAPSVFRTEVALWFGVITTLLFVVFGYGWLSELSYSLRTVLLFLWLFGMILWLAMGVVRHAECLAVKLGEPYGTLILTVSVIGIEASMIASVMLTGDNNPTLARDTMFSVVMIALNGILGLTLLLGGIRHHEQTYNLPGALSYLSVLAPLTILSLVVPSFTNSHPGGGVSPLLGFYLLFMSAGLYSVFLFLQTGHHRAFFKQPAEKGDEVHNESHDGHEGLVIRSTGYHSLFLILTMLPIVLLAKSMATLIDFGTETLGAPQALGGLLVAILRLSPESLSAVKAALQNQLQRTINLTLGAATCSIGLTVPVILAISMITGLEIVLGLEALDIVLLSLTLLVSVISFTTGRSNVLQGVVHLILFASYIVLLFH